MMIRREISDVEAFAHFLAGLEIGDALGGDVDRFAGAGIAALAGVAAADREGAEAAQLDPAAALQLLDDRIEEGRDDPLDLLQGQVRMVVAELLDQFGSDHLLPPFHGNRPATAPGRLLAPPRGSTPIPRTEPNKNQYRAAHENPSNSIS